MKCPKCQKEIIDQSIFCSVCGYKIANDEMQSRNVRGECFNIKRVILAFLCLVALITLVICICINLTPKSKYRKAERAFANEKYEKAINYYTQAGDYRDSVDKLKISEIALHYVTAKNMMEKKEFDNAKKELEFTTDYKDTENLVQQCDYGLGQIYMDQEKYALAAEVFNRSLEYEDSKDKIFEIGKRCIENGSYEDAKKAFEYISEDNYIYYVQGMIALNKENYGSAQKNFAKAKGLYDAEERYVEATYYHAKKLMERGKYGEARNAFKTITDYKDATELITVCELMDAKADFDIGKLSSAKEKLEKLPLGYDYNGVKVSELLDKLNNNSNWVAFTGNWKSISGEASANCKSKDGWYDGTWSSQIGSNEYTLNIQCILNDDGTIRLTGTGTIFVYTHWSTLQIGLNSNKSYPISFDRVINPSEFSDTITIDELTTIKFSEKKVVVDYNYQDNNADTSFNYRYRTNISYEKK